MDVARRRAERDRCRRRSKPSLATLDGVDAVHDLHVWPLSTTETALTAHLVAPRRLSTDALLSERPDDAPRPLRHRAFDHPGRTRRIGDDTATADRVNVTHLECSLTGERYDAGQVHNLSRAGKPLLVRYDLEAAKRDADAAKASRRASRACGNGASCCRSRRRRAGQPRRARNADRAADRRTGGPNLLVKDEGRLPTGSFKARGLAMAVTMAKQFGIERIAMPTNGNAGAALAAYGARAGIETIVICPAETPAINVRETAAYGARVYVADGQIDECGALVGEGRGGRACGSTARR